MPRSITLQQLAQMMPSNPNIIDVREPYMFARYHLPTAKNVPFHSLTMYPERFMNMQETYYLICDHGSVSYRAASILSAYGYKIVSISGGYDSRRYQR